MIDGNRMKNDGVSFRWPSALGVTIGTVLVVISAQIFEIYFRTGAWVQMRDTIPSLLALIIALASLLVSYGMFIELPLIKQAGIAPVIFGYLGSYDDPRVLSTPESTNASAGAAERLDKIEQSAQKSFRYLNSP